MITCFKIQIDPSIHKLDPNIPPTQFDERLFNESKKGIRVGFLESMDTVPASDA